ncbi:CRE-GCK-4 protein [Caenorhabditis remanei]|uniref:CRE-GCK-4 protein n=1 Tax=Caenorhabditis remanei TaxID=31234 RepID=E3ME22_CAERE|nr:CRE-GCK-4 protein [Caenorhabditis remanei]
MKGEKNKKIQKIPIFRMAPEVMACETFKDQPYDCISDIWSFGITLIEMAQGEPPHSDVSVMRVYIKVLKSDPPTLLQPSHWTRTFNDILARCLVKDPRNRPSAATIFEHPWFNNAPSKKKMILDLLAEMNAEVQEEVVIDGDEESVAGSDEISQRRGGDSWSSASDSPRPATTEGFKVPMLPPSIETPPPDTPHKKRAAPPPPQEAVAHQSPVLNGKADSSSYTEPIKLKKLLNNSMFQFSFSNSNTFSEGTAEFSTPSSNKSSVHLSTPAVLSLNTSGSPSSANEFVSPRREALSILDELTTTLDDEQSSNYFNSPRSVGSATGSARESPRQSPRNSPSNSPQKEQREDQSGGHSIRDTILANRQRKSLSPQLRRKFCYFTEKKGEKCHKLIFSELSPSESGSSSFDENVNLSFHKLEPAEHAGYIVAQQNMERATAKLQERAAASHQAKIEERQAEEARVKQRQASTDSSEKRISRSSSPSHSAGQPETVFKKQSQEMSTSFTARDTPFGKSELTVSATSSPAKIRPSPQRTSSNHSVRTSNSSNSIPHHSASSSTDFAATPIPANPEYFDVPKRSGHQKDKTPPPEPPVDYEGSAKENAAPVATAATAAKTLQPAEPTSSTSNAAQKTNSKPLGGRRDGNRQTITKKTRTYMIDGVQVTSTTVHVLGVKDDKVQRKQQLHDLRRLQRDEARQKQELQSEGIKLVDEQARKFTSEQTNLTRTSELEMDAMERRQRKEIEDTEGSQEQELRNAQKRLRVEQEKDMRAFKERLKQEMKIFKQELTMLSKVQRKDALKQRKDQIEIEHQLKEKDFLMQLQQNAEAMLQRMAEKHKERMASIEKQFLMQKHNLLRAKENNIWELEDKQMREKFVLHRKLFKDEYYLLRTQMLARHQREMAQIEKNHQEEEEELIRALTLDRKKLPKMLRAETKTRSVMFKESLRISSTNMSNSEMQERIRRFDEQESLRMRAALEDHDMKSQKKLQALKDRHHAAVIELDEMQNEKRKQLLEKERNTMKEHEAKYHEMRELWQENLIARKTVLEEKFEDELSKQEVFYGMSYTPSQASTLSGRHMP